MLVCLSTDLSPLLGSGRSYGSYSVLGNLSIALAGSGEYTEYRRELDLRTGVHTTTFTLPGSSDAGGTQKITEKTFCSFPDQVCVYELSSSSSASRLPAIGVRLENILVDQSLISVVCNKDMVRLSGVTQAGPPEGMRYDSIAQLREHAGQTSSCNEEGSTLTVTPGQDQRSVVLVISAGTNYDQTKGNAESGFSFKGVDPAEQVEQQASAAAAKSFDEMLETHLQDYSRLESAFKLNLPDAAEDSSSAETETSTLIEEYTVDGPGNPYLEALLFDYARYMLIASSRADSLPANLQGRWADGIESDWGADYHANINLQMNYWHAEQTGLSDTYDALWNYMQNTWVPRGTETARLLYNATEGWVVHNEMNIFGHTAMKEEAGWANCKSL